MRIVGESPPLCDAKIARTCAVISQDKKRAVFGVIGSAGGILPPTTSALPNTETYQPTDHHKLPPQTTDNEGRFLYCKMISSSTRYKYRVT